jgi:hypothetical protein
MIENQIFEEKILFSISFRSFFFDHLVTSINRREKFVGVFRGIEG